MVGGCCGTTPAHIRNLVRSVRMVQPARRGGGGAAAGGGRRRRRRRSPREEKSPLARKLGKQFVVSVELDPPKGADPGRIIDRAQYCKENEVDAINVADGPRASARMSAQSLCVLMQGKVGIDTILHYTCRDRNLLGIQSDLLGAYALGLRNILAITGDPPKLGDYPGRHRGLRRGLHRAHPDHEPPEPRLRPGRQPHRARARHPHRLRRRPQQAGPREGDPPPGGEGEGGRGIHHDAARLRPRAPSSGSSDSIKHLDVPVLVGILPLYSHKNAEFLHNEVPGMTHPGGHPRADAEGRLRRGRPRRRA